ncbi:DUF2000 domain-containing protein [Wukongibacter sp. M2B1]|uniref:DUF2000 domain-containing protein n=1 Tax=Wukongibacter sp. M2B1 TaxID=3088895 RepID=UPI003D7AE675
MKCVMIIDKDLPIGLIANTAAALGISLASETKDLIGKKLKDINGRVHEGITNIPIPILALSKEELKDKYDEILEKDNQDLKIIGFNDVAQKSLSYDDYEIKLASSDKAQINYLGLCIYGPKKKVNKLTGNLKMLR